MATLSERPRLMVWASHYRERVREGTLACPPEGEHRDAVLEAAQDAENRLETAWADRATVNVEREQLWPKAGGSITRKDAIDALGCAFEKLARDPGGRGATRALEHCDDLWQYAALASYLADDTAPYCNVNGVVSNALLEGQLIALSRWLKRYVESELDKHGLTRSRGPPSSGRPASPSSGRQTFNGPQFSLSPRVHYASPPRTTHTPHSLEASPPRSTAATEVILHESQRQRQRSEAALRMNQHRLYEDCSYGFDHAYDDFDARPNNSHRDDFLDHYGSFQASEVHGHSPNVEFDLIDRNADGVIDRTEWLSYQSDPLQYARSSAGNLQGDVRSRGYESESFRKGLSLGDLFSKHGLQ